MKAGEMTRVVEEKKLSELAVKYGFDAAKVRKLNPEIADPDKLTPGQVVWRVQRSVVPAGIHGTLKDFCREYLGNEKAESAVQGANPAITDPSSLKPDDRVTIPATVATPPVAAPSPTTKEFSAAIRRGEAVATVSTAENKPYVHVHDPKRVEALGKWLETQKFDRERRDAAKLGARFRGGEESFQKGRRGTYIQFLSRGYPDIVDPIFPEDPRYDKHIIRRP
jgi:hypothetical protein